MQIPPRPRLPGETDLLSGLGGLEQSARDVERVTCEHAERCGGCPIIGLPYGEQLSLKRGRVVQSASRYAALELTYTEPVAPAEPIVGYRTRAKLIVAPGGRVGLYAKGGGHLVVDIPNCRVLSPALAEVAAALRAIVAEDEASGGPLAPFDASLTGGRGCLRAVDLREVRGDGDHARVLVTLVLQRQRAPAREVLEARARDLATCAPVAGVAVNLHDGESPQILGNETAVLHGVASASDRLGKSTHQATYGSFVQAHRGQAERVHGTLVELLGITTRASAREPGRPVRVLDLYGGSGAIALSLAHAGAEVHLVESFAPAAAHAEQAARAQGLAVKAEASDVASALRRIVEHRAVLDAVVVNPPRRGMSPLARELLGRLDVPTIAYVSCDPDTLARDLDHFVRLGWTVSTLQPLDMIPLTDEVETIALLRRVPLPPARVAYDDDEVVIVEKGPHEPTTPQGEYASSLLARVRRLPDCGEAVAVHRLDVGTSGLVMFVKRPEALERWQVVSNAETSRRVYVAGARGVTPSKGAITRDLREDGKLLTARTRYRRLAVASGHSVLRVVPEHGRMHQIRRHLAAIGHPVLGDERYGHPATNRYFEEKNALDRTFLHCVRLEFDHPDSAQRMIVEAPMPGDLRAVLERTSGPGTLRFLDHKNALGHGGSSLPPPPERADHRGSALDIDSSSPSIRPDELVNDDDDVGSRPSQV